MTTKVNGKAMAGAFLGGSISFFTVTTTTNILGGTSPVADAITPSGTGDALVASQAAKAAAQKAEKLASQVAFDKAIEVVSLNGQPTILGAVTKNGSDYTFKFANEHVAAWDAASLKKALEDHAFLTGVVVAAVAL